MAGVWAVTHPYLSIRATEGSLPCGRYLLAPLTGNNERSMGLMCIPTRLPTKVPYTPLDNTSLHSIAIYHRTNFSSWDFYICAIHKHPSCSLYIYYVYLVEIAPNLTVKPPSPTGKRAQTIERRPPRRKCNLSSSPCPIEMPFLCS